LSPRDARASLLTHEEVERSIPERFTTIVESRGLEWAIVAGKDRISYVDLARRVDALAAEILRRQGESPSPVAVLVRDPVQAVAVVFATWQAGKLCVSIDAGLPAARVATILRHSQAGLAITDRSLAAAVGDNADIARPEFRIDMFTQVDAEGRSHARVTGGSPACIFYTSGSTGEPKGVLRTHRSLLHRARGSIASLGIRTDDRVGIAHAPTSAAGIRDVLATLLGGAVLSTFDLREGGFGELVRWIESERITVLCGAVSTWRHVFADIDAAVRFRSLRMVRLGSEPIYRRDVERLREHVPPDCVLVTGYGATEASGIVEYRMDGTTPLPAGRIPAGYAGEGVELAIQDEERRPVEAGEAGEVVVRCDYLASGYWREETLTRTVFDRNPDDAQVCAYRTGDIGRLRADGCLEILGRRDDRIKIRGHRVNPGEIELALYEHALVRQAAVTSRVDDDGDIRLVAYVVPQSGSMPTAQLLRRHLQGRLPAYMGPSAFVMLESMPLTATGKVDRSALPVPQPSAQTGDQVFVAPRSPTEHQLAEIWERVFGVAPIGARDNFFDLGGDSLIAAAMVSAIEETLGRTVPPALLLQASTVSELAAAMTEADASSVEPLTGLRTTGSGTPIFFLHNDAGRGLYTHALARRIDAARPFFAVHRDGLSELPVRPTVEALAAERIRALRALRPRGPYVLGGHCHGGLIAFEMARQLRAAGEEIEWVIMVDTDAPAGRLRVLRRAFNLANQMRGRVRQELDERFEFAARVGREIRWRARYYPKRVGALASEGIVAQFDFVLRKLRISSRSDHGGKGGSARRFYAEPPRPSDVRQAQRRAYKRYMPSRYAGRVVLFRAEQYPAERPDLGWSEYLPRLEVVVVPGDHHSCITRHVATLAERVNEILSKADRG
jgi:amino acid adenylation domain-containing protein